ncbi:hypothetical protein ISF_00245 [Cordyceps fumosorosea ARSEF 2679]|uniref:Uncharacterized protein n=1 Tax=Cordyceps fumosorosea (strain ARSEF 2679) TaxID=1081104 RepID=A0A162LNK2_CORFA|nr:hypothetical protein ISF_00245 [Cordyceps fumosorosea ARSEF 2679]OAA73344.1 hypothetical protein ISF_00245 [Cordyceps fumosorosea ARSEF 2679]
MSLTDIDPDEVFFTFSRLRPQFSCGRRVRDTLDAALRGSLVPADLPPISVLRDPATGHLFSLNNRRLYVFKALRAAGRLETVPARVKPVPQTKRMRDKYAADKCAKTARLMGEREAEAVDGEAEGVNGDEEEGGGEAAEGAKEEGSSSVTPRKSSKPPKPVRNMDDWTDEEDIGKKKKGTRGKKGR